MSKKMTGYPSIDKPWLKYYNSSETFTVPMKKNFDYVHDRAKHNGKRTALRYFNTKISFDRLFQNVEAAAKALKVMKVKEGDIISVCLPNVPEVVYIYYAINRVGAVANMLDLRCNASELLRSCSDANSELLIALDMVLEKFSDHQAQTKIKQIIAVSPLNALGGVASAAAEMRLKIQNHRKSILTWNEFIKKGSTYSGSIDSPFRPDTASVIAYTGGTTGKPKGVIVTNESLNSILEMNNYNRFNAKDGQTSLVIAPPWTYYGLNNCINGHLSLNQQLILIPKCGSEELGQLILKHKPNHIVTVPSALKAVIRDIPTGFDLSFLKTITVGADKLTETFEHEVNAFLKEHHADCVLTKGYGMTEVTAASSFTLDNCNFAGSVGVPYVGNIISAFDPETREEKKTGEKGEIAICGPTLMQGYFGSAAAETDTVLKRHADGRIWAHTGDIGHLDENGVLYIDGRIKRMFTKNGYKIFAGEVENQIMRSGIAESCAVVAVPDDLLGFKEIAFVVLKTTCGRKMLKIQSMLF